MRVFVYECITAGGMGSTVPDSLRREGRAMLDAVVGDFRRIPGFAVETLADELDQPTRFHELAPSCDWTLVIAPEFQRLLQNYAQAVLDAGGRLLGSTPFAIRTTGDKLRMAKAWERLNVLQPQVNTLPLGRIKDIYPTIDGPWVIKPRDGAGSQATMLVTDIDDWLCAVKAIRQEWPVGQFLVQRFVPGQAASVALLIGPAQTMALIPARQHLSNDGRFRYEGGSFPLPPPLAERATRLALQAVAGIDGLQGYVGVDLVLGDDGVDYAIEINPRLTTSYIGLRQLCEENLAELMLRILQGERLEPPAWKAGDVRFHADGTLEH